MRHYIHYWNQPEEQVDTTTHTIEAFWNPHRGNVRVAGKEIKWYNLFNNKPL